MHHLIRVRAHITDGVTTWSFVGSEFPDYVPNVLSGPDIIVNDGDVWTTDVLTTKKPSRRGTKSQPGVATLRPITRVQMRQAWESLTSIPNFWTDPVQLKAILLWLHAGQPVVLVGPKGTGKSSLGYALTKALGWQDPCKVDVYMAKKTSDLFGSDAAQDGSTLFRGSALLDFLERAWIAHTAETGDRFLLILDELNRVHAKSNESLHGLFDDIGQITFMTTQGPKMIKLPPNVAVVATMNMGYTGTFDLDRQCATDSCRCVSRMPIDTEVEMVVKACNINPAQALRS